MPESMRHADFEDAAVQKAIKATLGIVSLFPAGIALNILGRCAGHMLADVSKSYGFRDGADAREHFNESVQQGQTDEFIWRQREADGVRIIGDG